MYSVQLSVTPTDERTCVTDTCSIFTEDPFPLCFSRTTSNNKPNNKPFSPQLGCVPGLLLSSSRGFHSACPPHRPSPLAVLAFRLVPAFTHTPGRCLFRETGMPRFSPTSRCWPFAPYEACIIFIPLTHPYRLCSKFLRPKAL